MHLSKSYKWALGNPSALTIGVWGLYTSAGFQRYPHPQLQRLSFSVKALWLSDIVTGAPFPSTKFQGRPHFLLLVMVGHLAILVRCLQKPPFLVQSQGLPFLLRYFACSAQDIWQSYQTELGTAEIIGETCLPFASSLLSLLGCNGESPAFISPLATHSCVLPNRMSSKSRSGLSLLFSPNTV